MCVISHNIRAAHKLLILLNYLRFYVVSTNRSEWSFKVSCLNLSGVKYSDQSNMAYLILHNYTGYIAITY